MSMRLPISLQMTYESLLVLERKLVPNVVYYRLNHALVHSPKTLRQRWSGLAYYDGVIHNAFGIPTEQLLSAMRELRFGSYSTVATVPGMPYLSRLKSIMRSFCL